MAKLTVHTDTLFDSVWHFSMTLDPVEQEELHATMIIQMARYGRQRIEDLEQMELPELLRYYRRLVKVIGQEGAFTRASEEG